jgi:oligopeptide transport system substrate-binding protein
MRQVIFGLCVALLMIPLGTLAQDDATERVPLRVAGTGYPTTFDPLFASSAADAQILPNLFLSLTRIDPLTGAPNPALAESWSISIDGLTWTFTLRDDIPWVLYDPVQDTFEQFRTINADDMVYSIQRLCSQAEGGYYATDVVGQRIAGCAEGQAAGDGTLAQVSAEGNDLQITLTAPYAYFDSIASLWTLAPVPREALDGFGDQWTIPGNLITSGAFALAEASLETNTLTLVANPFFPPDLRAGGNVNVVEYTRTEETTTAFRLYRDGLVDLAPIPASQQTAIFANEDFSGETYAVPQLTVFYLGFDTSQPPFDDIHVRRAFSAVLDRDGFIETVRDGRGTPVKHFIPEGIAFGPPRNFSETVGFNLDFAREEMTRSAYPNCANLPPVTIYTYEGASGWAGFLVDSLVNELNCSDTAFNIERRSFTDLRTAIDPDTPAEQRPQMFTFGNSPDYNDASTFADVLTCGPENYFGRQTCDSVDDLIRSAGLTTDPNARTEGYQLIEAALFGIEGRFPLIPLFQLTRYTAAKPWVSGPIETVYDARYFDAYSVDTEARGAVLVCSLSAAQNVNLRGGPGTNFDVVGMLEANVAQNAVAQTNGTDGFTWWQVESGAWVREDVVLEDGMCAALPVVDS